MAKKADASVQTEAKATADDLKQSLIDLCLNLVDDIEGKRREDTPELLKVIDQIYNSVK